MSMWISSVKNMWIQNIFIALYVIFFAISVLFSLKFSVLISIGLLLIIFFNDKQNLLLFLIVFLLPFSGTALLNQQIAGLPGLKFHNLLVVLASIFYLKSSYKFKMSDFEIWFIVGTVFFFSICIIKSLPHLHEINMYNSESLSASRYILSNFVRPLLFLVPFLLIASFYKSRADLLFLTNALIVSLVFCSLILIIAGGYSMLNFGTGRRALISMFGIHSNNLATFYMLGYPFVLMRFVVKRDMIGFVGLILVLAGAGICYSRTAYFVVIFSTLLLFVIEKNKKWVPYIIMLCCALVFISPSSIAERSMKGIQEGDINKISAGRVYDIWQPALEAFNDDLFGIIFGNGRYSIIYASQVERGHPHNMYLEAMFDAGLLGLLFFCVSFGIMIKRINKGIGREEDYRLRMVLKSALISIVAFMVCGLAGRHFFPDISNSFLWVIVALALSILKVHDSERAGANG